MTEITSIFGDSIARSTAPGIPSQGSSLPLTTFQQRSSTEGPTHSSYSTEALQAPITQTTNCAAGATVKDGNEYHNETVGTSTDSLDPPNHDPNPDFPLNLIAEDFPEYPSASIEEGGHAFEDALYNAGENQPTSTINEQGGEPAQGAKDWLFDYTAYHELDPHDIIPELSDLHDLASLATLDATEPGREQTFTNFDDINREDKCQQIRTEPEDGDDEDTSKLPTGLDADSKDQPAAPKWEFRESARQKLIGFSNPWTDVDDSGDYDPTKKDVEGSLVQPKRKKSTYDLQADHRPSDGDPLKRPRHSSFVIRRQVGASFVITLNFRAEASKERLRNIPDNWPEGTDNTFEDESLSSSVAADGPYRLRRRGAEDSKPEEVIELGHPEARGCKACLTLKDTCSLLTNPYQYPCGLCYEDDCDCELLIQPQRKQACISCLSRKLKCSYADTEDNVGACRQCTLSKRQCLAGPAPVPGRTRIDEHGKAITLGNELTERRCKSCAQCRRLGQGKKCSALDGSEPPCSHCKEKGVVCTFEKITWQLPKPSDRPRDLGSCIFKKPPKPVQVQAKPPQSLTAPTIPTSAMTTPPTNSALRPANSNPVSIHRPNPKLQSIPGTTITIRTRLSHPITFKFLPQPPKKLCHFCSTNPIYPLYGHAGPVRTVRAILWSNRKAYTELRNGHTNAGCAPTRVCTDCTFARLKVILCKGHVMREMLLPTKEKKTRREDFPGMIMDLMKTKGSAATNAFGEVEAGAGADSVRIRGELARWCMICPSGATHECCTEQSGGGEGTVERKSERERAKGKGRVVPCGCGLKLCWACSNLLKGLFGGDLGKMMERMLGREPPQKFYPRGLRADAELLVRDGLLIRQVTDRSR